MTETGCNLVSETENQVSKRRHILIALGMEKPALAKLPTRTHKCADEPELPKKRRSPNPAGRASRVPQKVQERIRKEYAIGARLRERAAKHTLTAMTKKYKLSKPTLWHICQVANES